MTAVYAIVLGVGVIALLAWVAATAIADTVEGWEHVDPDTRLGMWGRLAVAAALGFGLAGMSATFAGWPWIAAFAGAIGGGGFVAVVALRYGPRPDDASGPEAAG